MSRNDTSQRQAADRYRESFMPYRGGYVVKASGKSDPICITSEQREQLVEAYSAAFSATMRVVMALVIAGLVAWFVVMARWDLAFHQWPILALILAIGTLSYGIVQRAIRRTIDGFGPRPLVLPADYAAWQRQRVRNISWSSIVLPTLVVPIMALQWHMHLPPRNADDYSAVLLIGGLATVLSWAAIRKLHAERG